MFVVHPQPLIQEHLCYHSTSATQWIIQGLKRQPKLNFNKTQERKPNKLRYKVYKNLNHYFLAYENFIPLILIKCNGFTPIMHRLPLNHALLAVVVGLTFLAFLCTLCNTIDTNYFVTSAHLTLVFTSPSFQPRTTPALLIGCQRPPPAHNIAVFHCTEHWETVNNYFSNLTLLPRTTLALLFGRQWLLLASNTAVTTVNKPTLSTTGLPLLHSWCGRLMQQW